MLSSLQADSQVTLTHSRLELVLQKMKLSDPLFLTQKAPQPPLFGEGSGQEGRVFITILWKKDSSDRTLRYCTTDMVLFLLFFFKCKIHIINAFKEANPNNNYETDHKREPAEGEAELSSDVSPTASEASLTGLHGLIRIWF